MNDEPSDPSDPSLQASREEEEELRRMRQAIAQRADRRLWELLPKRALFRAFWLVLLLLLILWLQRNSGRVTHFFQQVFPTTPQGPTTAPGTAK
ncbi:MAG: hypothetical protein SF187_10540 [Deltaproteobacteria bacterium]|nr:hypothetical protein [Deltaproteobacteria bacterium]